MRISAQRFGRRFGGAVAVLIMGVLLVQHVPLGPSASRHAGGAGHGGCTEQACHCGADCSCAHCAHHDGSRDGAESAPGPEEAPVDGPTLRSCGGPAGPMGVFTVSKSLLAPGISATVGRPSPPAHLIHRRKVVAPQRVADELFRPPRRRIG
jgi:hypothetical protein